MHKEHPGFASMSKGLDKIKEVVAKIDKEKARTAPCVHARPDSPYPSRCGPRRLRWQALFEQRMRLLHLHKRLAGEFDPLVIPTRQLVLEGTVTEIARRATTKAELQRKGRLKADQSLKGAAAVVPQATASPCWHRHSLPALGANGGIALFDVAGASDTLARRIQQEVASLQQPLRFPVQRFPVVVRGKPWPNKLSRTSAQQDLGSSPRPPAFGRRCCAATGTKCSRPFTSGHAGRCSAHPR